MSTRRDLRALISRNAPLLVPGTPNALTARIAEEVGFRAIYVSGAGIANTFLGVPDIGLVTLPELADHVAAIREAVDVPLIVDADTGFGNAIGVRRTIRMLEQAGADAIQIEDQVSPKRCGHFAGKSVITCGEMIGKIHAAQDARRDDDLIIIARTDARASEGFESAIERAIAYREAGADGIFVEAPRDSQELAQIPRRVPALHVANMVEGGLTPLTPLDELFDMGFSIVLYANTALRAAARSMREVLDHLYRRGDTEQAREQIVSWQDRQSLVRKPQFDALDQKYGAHDSGN